MTALKKKNISLSLPPRPPPLSLPLMLKNLTGCILISSHQEINPLTHYY